VSEFPREVQWHDVCTSRVGSSWVLVSVHCMPTESKCVELSLPEWPVRAAASPEGAQEVEGPHGPKGKYHERTPASIHSSTFYYPGQPDRLMLEKAQHQFLSFASSCNSC
jgi:hypothetical protein